MIELNKIYNEDCLEGMKRIPDNSVDMVLCDLPYGTTRCKWDVVIPFDKLWLEYERIIKDRGAIVLTASQPFTSALVMSNPKLYHHCWVWDKKFAGNYAQAKRQPQRIHEDILVFGHIVNYYPQMVQRDKPIKKGKNKGAEIYGGISGLGRPDYEGKVYDKKYPETILHFSSRKEPRGFHPTQKPVPLFEYLIRTYTNDGETVLDNCIGSGTTAIACINTNRNFIGFELDKHYCDIAQDRINKAKSAWLDELLGGEV